MFVLVIGRLRLIRWIVETEDDGDDADNEHTIELAPGRSFFRAAAPTKEDLRRFHDCREERTRFLVSIFDLVQNCASPWWCLPPLPQVDRTNTSL